MISLVRLDERMIHGQVAIKWTRHLNVDRIVVVSDSAAANPIVQKSLMMAAPPTAKVAIKSRVDAIPLINDPRMAPHNLLIIVSTPEDLLAIVKEVPGIPLVNVGNYGRVATKKNNLVRKTYAPNLYLYPQEVEIFNEVVDSGIKCNYQTIPDDAPQDLKKVISE